MFNDNNVVFRKATDFAIRIVKLYKFLLSKDEVVMSKQILRSGTSIGANVSEAVYGQSELDFVSKFSIALKETSETQYWLYLLYKTDYISENQYDSLKIDCDEIIKIITSIVKTTKKKHDDV